MSNSKTKALKKDIKSGNQVNAKGNPVALDNSGACAKCGGKHATKDHK